MKCWCGSPGAGRPDTIRPMQGADSVWYGTLKRLYRTWRKSGGNPAALALRYRPPVKLRSGKALAFAEAAINCPDVRSFIEAHGRLPQPAATFYAYRLAFRPACGAGSSAFCSQAAGCGADAQGAGSRQTSLPGGPHDEARAKHWKTARNRPGTFGGYLGSGGSFRRHHQGVKGVLNSFLRVLSRRLSEIFGRACYMADESVDILSERKRTRPGR